MGIFPSTLPPYNWKRDAWAQKEQKEARYIQVLGIYRTFIVTSYRPCIVCSKRN